MRLVGLLVSIVMLSTSAAFAQGGPGMRAAGPGPGGHMGGPMGGFGMHQAHKVVTGEPYSADVTDTSVTTLPDANTIQHSTTGHVARDSQGRTYSTETVTGGMMGQAGSKTFTFISDPVAGYSYVLNATTKTAMRRVIHTPKGTPPEPKTHPADPNVVATDLGTQMINGVSAQGKKTTRTIAAGVMGNTMPLVSTSETWYSPDLKVVVESKRIDPRLGLSTYALTNIQLTEPAATLFQVPADYTVTDAGGPGGFKRK